MKRRASTELNERFKKLRISKKGTSRLPPIVTKGLKKPKYGVTRGLNFGKSKRDRQLKF